MTQPSGICDPSADPVAFDWNEMTASGEELRFGLEERHLPRCAERDVPHGRLTGPALVAATYAALGHPG